MKIKVSFIHTSLAKVEAEMEIQEAFNEISDVELEAFGETDTEALGEEMQNIDVYAKVTSSKPEESVEEELEDWFDQRQKVSKHSKSTAVTAVDS